DGELGLSDADGLDDDDIVAEGIEQLHDFAGGAAESAVAPARREASDIDRLILVVIGHPDPVAEDRASGEGAGGIDREDGDLLAERAILGDQAVDEGGFAGARRPGNPDHVRLPSHRVDPLDDRACLGGAVFDQRDEAGERVAIAASELFEAILEPGIDRSGWGMEWR